jgi:hypothetical protein
MFGGRFGASKKRLRNTGCAAPWRIFSSNKIVPLKKKNIFVINGSALYTLFKYLKSILKKFKNI